MSVSIYVASSWRNDRQQAVVKRLRDEGFKVYDFRNPSPGNHGFKWSEIDPAWQTWSPHDFRGALHHDIAVDGFETDMIALEKCDVCVLVNPCGRSAHLELGYAAGYGKPAFILLAEGDEPELMYRMANCLCTGLDELVERLRRRFPFELHPARATGDAA